MGRPPETITTTLHSTGLNVVGALQLARELGPGHAVVTVACDSGIKYLAGDLCTASDSARREP